MTGEQSGGNQPPPCEVGFSDPDSWCWVGYLSSFPGRVQVQIGKSHIPEPSQSQANSGWLVVLETYTPRMVHQLLPCPQGSREAQRLNVCVGTRQREHPPSLTNVGSAVASVLVLPSCRAQTWLPWVLACSGISSQLYPLSVFPPRKWGDHPTWC